MTAKKKPATGARKRSARVAPSELPKPRNPKPTTTRSAPAKQPPKTKAAMLDPRPDRRYSRGIRHSGNEIGNEVRDQAAVRWLQCHQVLDMTVGLPGISLRQLGILMGKTMPWRTRPYDQSITQRIRAGTRAIRLEDVVAFATVLHDHGVDIDAGWIAFGDLSRAPAPPDALLERARVWAAQHER